MKKIFAHIGIWLVLCYFLFASLSLFLPEILAATRALTSIGFIAGMFYFAGWVLSEQFLIRRYRPVLFVLAALITIIAFSVFRIKVIDVLPGDLPDFTSQSLFENWLSQKSTSRQRIFGLINQLGNGRRAFLNGFLLNIITLVIASLYRLYEHKSQKELESREKLRHSQEAQILYLKSQVNPHFLFNTLNNLYGLAYSKSDLAPQMILGLSATMRYLIYETEQKLVPIEKELNFIRNYLNLEKMRISYSENIRISIQVEQPAAFIPPLLFLPFIENCFKHGTIGKEEDGWMELDIWDEKESLNFVCKNSFHYQKIFEAKGIGLDNVKKRLNLIFDDKFELKTVKQDDEYLVSLQFPVFTKID